MKNKKKRKEKVAVLGLGYVGMPTFLVLSNLKKNNSYLYHLVGLENNNYEGNKKIDSFQKKIKTIYSSDKYLGINYRKAMDRIHAIKLNGEIIKDVEVFREAYRLIGLGWIYYPTKLPVFKNIIDLIYISWAKSRLKLTNRKSLDELCLSKKK